jgi:hypothetical protein
MLRVATEMGFVIDFVSPMNPSSNLLFRYLSPQHVCRQLGSEAAT